VPSLLDVYRTSSWDLVAAELRKRYIQSETALNVQREMSNRKRLYKDGGDDIMRKLIDEIFSDAENIELRKAAIPYAKYDNALKRIVREKSTVYRKAATRRVSGRDNAARYRKAIELSQLDRKLKKANEYQNFLNGVFLQVRVRDESRGRVPVVDVLTPDQFWLVCDPDDRTKLAAIIIDQGSRGEGKRRYLVWSDAESFYLTTEGNMMKETLEENPFGRIPGVYAPLDPAEETLFDPSPGADLVAAHLAAWFQNILMFKESKSMTKQTVWSGDLETTPSGQPQDTELDNIAGEGVTAQTIDRGVDIEKYMRAADHIIERAAANHGISPDTLRHRGVSSGYEQDLRRIPIEERRAEQIVGWRDIERELAEVMSIVLSVDAPDLAFKVDGWSIDFSEVPRHLSEKEKYELRKVKRSMGHSNAFSEAMEDNPDFDEDSAKSWVLSNLDAHALFVVLARALNMPHSADADNPGRSPEDNGADNDSTAATGAENRDTGTAPGKAGFNGDGYQ